MNSHKTAISRKALPAPVKWLLQNRWIYGDVLDFGCGKCADINAREFPKYPDVQSIVSYDPYFNPHAHSLNNHPVPGFDIVLCTYVLNTVPPEEERQIIKTLTSVLRPNGLAFATVRTDKPRGGYGLSTKGTYQREVNLPYVNLKEGPHYRIYLLTSRTIPV